MRPNIESERQNILLFGHIRIHVLKKASDWDGILATVRVDDSTTILTHDSDAILDNIRTVNCLESGGVSMILSP